MSLSSQPHRLPTAGSDIWVSLDGSTHPAEEIARGAAYEVLSAEPAPGFEPVRRPDARLPFHRYVHVSDLSAVRGGTGGADLDAPLMAPVGRHRNWAELHQLSQRPASATDPVLTAVRASAVVRRGTPMVKVLSARQLAGFVQGWLPYGFCYREYDVAHLRTSTDLAVLRTDPDPGRDDPDVTYALRWRAIDPVDYQVPTAQAQPGLVTMPPHDRMGPAVLGTGFTPSGRHLIPEFATRDLADLPMPANAALVAYPASGEEVVLYTFRPEQRGWLRMAGPRWRHLLAAVPGVSPDQEYLPVGETPSTRLVGEHQGAEYEAVADLPGGFRVLAMTTAARFPVDRVHRRTRFVLWRGARCVALRSDANWIRVRLCRPDPDNVPALGAQCYERGVYEAWAPVAEIADDQTVDIRYPAED
ncbi:hypothetical protein [Plantactinospora sp. KBS50]|uniref:hypothetical protein n=1 Tax=Plantactinospora sp. KBS50 TaxID=2024580 RepID=UPI001E2EE132|nr:hypothetical protein [Plantactinospora sp. KBS50]